MRGSRAGARAPRAIMPGRSTIRRTRSSASYRGHDALRRRRHRISGQRDHACARHAVSLPRRPNAPRWPALRVLGGRVLAPARRPGLREFAKDGLKTWRKLNGVLCAATQSPSDVLASPIAARSSSRRRPRSSFRTPDANAAEYIEGFGLSEREFKLIKEQLEPGSRMFLVKQGHHSVVCQLDLKGFACRARGDFRARELRGAAVFDHGQGRARIPRNGCPRFEHSFD